MLSPQARQQLRVTRTRVTARRDTVGQNMLKVLLSSCRTLVFFVLFNCYWKLNFLCGSRHLSTGEPCSKISHLSETSPETTKETETPETPLACAPPTVPKHCPDTPRALLTFPQAGPFRSPASRAQPKGSSVSTSLPGIDTHLLDTLLTPHLPPRPEGPLLPPSPLQLHPPVPPSGVRRSQNTSVGASFLPGYPARPPNQASTPTPWFKVPSLFQGPSLPGSQP